MKQVFFLIGRWMLMVERAYHLTDAYLAANRGDMVFRSDCLSRAYECERRLHSMMIQP